MTKSARLSQQSIPAVIALCALTTLCSFAAPKPSKSAPRAPVAFAPPARLGAPELQASASFQIIDWNGDGARDIVQRSGGRDRGWMAINKGTDRQPIFGTPERLPCNFSELEFQDVAAFGDIWATDFDGDGDLDFIFTVAARGRSGLMVAENIGQNKFAWLENGIILPDTTWNGTLCAVDVDGDGKQDIYQQPPRSSLILHRNQTADGKMAIGPAEKVTDTDGNPITVNNPYPIDFDGDGTGDLAGVTADGATLFLGVSGSKGLRFKPGIAATDPSGKNILGGNDVNIIDWDLDGVLDLLILDDSAVIRCHRGLSKGQPIFEAKPSLIHATAFARADVRANVALHDYDGDGRADLLISAGFDERCQSADPWARIYRNTLGEAPLALGDGAFVLGANEKNKRIISPFLCDFDGDGNTDIVYAYRTKGTTIEVYLLRGDNPYPGKFSREKELLLTLEASDKTGPRAFPRVVDWNGDGKLDIVANFYAYNETKFVVAFNEGSNQSPKFERAIELELDGNPIKAHQASISVADWDGDGHPNLLIAHRGRLGWLRNIDGTHKLELPLGDPVPPANKETTIGAQIKVGLGEAAQPIPASGEFSVGDFDGDGILDIVMVNHYFYGFYALADSRIWLYRGLPANTPQATGDLAATRTTDKSVTLSWSPPPDITRSEVRWSEQPLDEATWFTATPAKGQQQENGMEVTGLERGRLYHFAICHFGAIGERSALSNVVTVPTLPQRMAVLAQGLPAPALGVKSYSGCVDVMVRGGTPPTKAIDGKHLIVLWVPPNHDRRDWINPYLKFDISPLKGKKIKQATFTLTTTGGILRGDKRMLCTEVLADWQPETIQYVSRDGQTDWKESDYGEPLIDLDSEPIHKRKRWDATEVLAQRLAAGGTTLSLRVSRSPYGSGNTFHSSESDDIQARPSLTIIFED